MRLSSFRAPSVEHHEKHLACLPSSPTTAKKKKVVSVPSPRWNIKPLALHPDKF